MIQISRWKILLGIVLIMLSTSVYVIHYMIFRDAHHIFIFMIHDIAFVFFEVLLVGIVIDGVMQYREKQAMMEKLNMVIGSFFSEFGTELLKYLTGFDPCRDKICQSVIVRENWTTTEFNDVYKLLKNYDYEIDIRQGDIDGLRQTLSEKREFLLRLLENPSLMEHESFTNLMMSLFHLTEELVARKNILQLSEADRNHLNTDIKRVYRMLVNEWLAYMNYLRNNYPYLFSFAMRTNPFDPTASVEIT
ncbi:MAG: hypothetical protein JXA41_16300 [Deltaproteobacteria bacterium]|nr:hypothetical protein [Deltaproteobacteria bacterium]